MATTINTDFVRFNAYQIKDLITRKLSENSGFTDQVYEGSNLAILIDLVSYMYQCLMYQLNFAAGESMWKDTQIYENINRLCSFLGYNPKGMTPNSVELCFDNRIAPENDEIEGDSTPSSTGGKYYGMTVLPYSYVKLNQPDSEGNPIYYSVTSRTSVKVNAEKFFQFIAYNGKWKLYDNGTPRIAEGIDYEVFVLDGIDPGHVSQDMIEVYVKRYEYSASKDTAERKVIHFMPVQEEMFKKSDNDDILTYSKLYDKTDNIFNVRLNSDKYYEIKFGNGVNGSKLMPGDEVYVMYLKSNALDVHLDEGQFRNLKLEVDDFRLGDTDDDPYVIGTDNIEKSSKLYSPDADAPDIFNTTQSSMSKDVETVEEIRDAAPRWFTTGNRLVTRNDYVYYVKNRFKDNVIDATCMNNWEYMSTFYKWLWAIGKKYHKNPKHYLNEHHIIKHGYKFSDPADFNNIYLWVKMRYDSDIFDNIIDTDIDSIKTLTSEVVYLKPVSVNFAICAAPKEVAQSYLKSTEQFDTDGESYLEVTLKSNAIYVNTVVQNQIQNMIVDYFSENNFQIGQYVNLNDLCDKLYKINGVENIRTVYKSSTDPDDYVIVNGLSFATWSADVISEFEDLNVSNTSIKLEKFQFPTLYMTNLMDKIKVIKHTMYNQSSVLY